MDLAKNLIKVGVTAYVVYGVVRDGIVLIALTIFREGRAGAEGPSGLA